MPAVAIVFAAEAVTAGMVMAAVAQVGIGMTVVGAVTGSKDMMKVGGAMSLIGGVGSLAAGSASAVGAAETAGTAAGTEVGSAEALDLFYGTDAASQAAGATLTESAATSMPIVDSGAGTEVRALSDLGAQVPTEGPNGLLTDAAQETAKPGLMQSQPAEQAVTGAPATPAQTAPTTTGAPTVSAPTAPAVQGAESVAETINKGTDLFKKAQQNGFWGDVKAWYKNLTESQKLLVGQMGFGAMQGAGAAYSKGQELEFLKERDARQNANANSVVPIVYRPGGIMTSGVR